MPRSASASRSPRGGGASVSSWFATNPRVPRFLHYDVGRIGRHIGSIIAVAAILLVVVLVRLSGGRRNNNVDAELNGRKTKAGQLQRTATQSIQLHSSRVQGCNLSRYQHPERVSMTYHSNSSFYMVGYDGGAETAGSSMISSRLRQQSIVDYVADALRRLDDAGVYRTSLASGTSGRTLFGSNFRDKPWLLDVGSDIGAFSLAVAAAGYPASAFESCPATAARLACSSTINGFDDHLLVFNAAVADHTSGDTRPSAGVDQPAVHPAAFGPGQSGTGSTSPGCGDGVAAGGTGGDGFMAITVSLDTLFDPGGAWHGVPGPAVLRFGCGGCAASELRGYQSWFTKHLPALIVVEGGGGLDVELVRVILASSSAGPAGYQLVADDISSAISVGQAAAHAIDTDINERLGMGRSRATVFVRKDLAGTILAASVSGSEPAANGLL